MSESKCDERGRFSEEYSNDEVLATVGKHKPTGTMKIAEELGIKRPNRLPAPLKLKHEDKVESKIIRNSLVWGRTPKAGA
jgi:hypothetical protein